MLARGKDVPVIDNNNGGEYWLATKRELPESFQVTIPCMVQFEQGRQHIQPSQRSILRCLAVRFGSDDTKTDILEPKGYLIKFTHMKLLLYREGSKSDSCVAFADVGNSATPMSLTI